MIADPSQATEPRSAPETFFGRLRFLGPGIIITGSIVGSGELIMTTKLGAEVGFTLLWLVILGCIIKVFVQVELGRYAISSGGTTLEAMNRLPGPRLVVSWLVWLWLGMFIALFFQVSGIAGSLGEIFTVLFPVESPESESGWKAFWIVVVTLSVIGLLVLGRYRTVERLSTAMVCLFTLFTIAAVGVLYRTEFAIEGGDILEGMSFRLTQNGELVDFTTAFAAFGITGVGASELIYYPYWCLEKGYARLVGPRDGSAEWEQRAKGWIRVLYLDAFVSLVVYTIATIAFYLLGAAILHAQSLEVADMELITTLSTMYRQSFGEASYDLFLLGAFFVLYSTFFVATASNARVFADALSVFRVVRYEGPRSRMRAVKLACVLLPTCSVLIFLRFETPVKLVMVGGVAQASMLPLLAAAALYLCYRCTDPALRPRRAWTVFLWLSFASMTAVGIYNICDELELFGKTGP